MHGPEVVPDEGKRRALRQALDQRVECRTEPSLLELDVGDVRLGADRVRDPWQPTGRQHASHAPRRQLPGLGQELRPVAAMFAQPVQKQHAGTRAPVGGLDEVGLDGGVALAHRRVRGPDPRSRSPGGRHRRALCVDGRDRAAAYHPRVVDVQLPPIRLTELTTCGGCAAKLGADALAEALAGLGVAGVDGLDGHDHGGSADGTMGLIAGLDPPDDAAVHLVAPGVAIIGTVDFFPPIVDDPRTFGEIAAANALSDVFAMGGRVLFALSVAAIPEDMPMSAFRAILDGAASKVREAGGILAGGHTIRDPEPKYGLAVIGVASPDRLLRKGGAQPGDLLLLTKALGTGLLVSGRRRGLTSDADLEGVIDSMRGLNRSAAEVLVDQGIRGATDVTGFGLLGHGLEMARASGTRFMFDAGALPALEGALELARAGVETGGATYNRRFLAPALSVGEGVDEAMVTLAHDPQTSGGLLAAVPEGNALSIEAALRAAGVEAWIVGRVEPAPEGAVALV